MATNSRNVARRRDQVSACFYFVLGALSLVAGLCSVLFVAQISILIEREFQIRIPGFFGALFLSVFLMLTGISWRRGRQHLAKIADKAVEDNPPIVLLRAFHMDQTPVKSNRFLTRFLQSLHLTVPPGD